MVDNLRLPRPSDLLSNGARGNADGKRKAEAVESKVCMRLCCGACAPVVTSCLGVVCVQDKKSEKRSGEGGSSSREGGGASKKSKQRSGEGGSSSREGGGATKNSKNRSGEGGSSSREVEKREKSWDCDNLNCYLLGSKPIPKRAEPCGVCVCVPLFARVCVIVFCGWVAHVTCAVQVTRIVGAASAG